ncbi:hypothetical protein Fmac_019488 [Flemingia macrophylla]|uniref:F-box protein n=1 Tax=Flemingia macrophylla TaxID=520843 RepID=A0ABD1M8D2_9FABA
MSDITTVHSDIIQTHILTRLDGPALASAALATSHLSAEQHLWRQICAATWPSLSDPLAAALVATFPGGHRSLFSDSFPSLQQQHASPPPKPRRSEPPEEVIWAVDIFYKGEPILSRAVRSETRKGWFLCSPLWVELLGPSEVVPTPLKVDESQWLSHLHDNLTLSWIIIDPSSKRAANLSSGRAVAARRHWLTAELEVLYAVPLTEEVECVIKVTCSGKMGGALHVREVSLAMEDAEGRHVSGGDSLVILQDAIENGKRVKPDPAEALRSFDNFCSVKREKRERRMRRDKAMDFLAMFVAFSVFATLFSFMAFSAF